MPLTPSLQRQQDPPHCGHRKEPTRDRGVPAQRWRNLGAVSATALPCTALDCMPMLLLMATTRLSWTPGETFHATHASHITRHTSHITHHTSHITRHSSRTTPHTSIFTPLVVHTSRLLHLAPHISHFTKHLTLLSFSINYTILFT
jgi:hypothetical protein